MATISRFGADPFRLESDPLFLEHDRLMNAAGNDSSLFRRFLRLTGYNILANLTIPLTGLVDTAMLGHLPDITFLAGVALASVIFDYLYWGLNFLRMGTTGTVAQATGKGDATEVQNILYRSLLIGLGAGLLILTLSEWIQDFAFAFLSGESPVKAAGRSYFQMRVLGAPAVLCNFVILGWLLGRERPVLALVVTAAGNIANVVLDYIFIMRLEMEAAGAGLATALSQYLMLLLGLGFVIALHSRTSFSFKDIFSPGKILGLLQLNIDLFIRTFCLLSGFALFLNFSASMGTQTLVLNTILHQLITFAAFLIDGPALAAEILIGTSAGRGDREAGRRTVRYSFSAGFAISLAFLLIFFVHPAFFLSLLTSHTDLIVLSEQFRFWMWPYLLFATGAYILDGLFVGLTRARELRNAMVFSVLVGFVPAACAAFHYQNNHILWGAMCLFALSRFMTLLFLYKR